MIIIGVDEVGRGSLVGSVVCCAYIHNSKNEKIDGITDSKKLSEKQRNFFENKIINQENKNYFCIEELNEVVVDKINILNATMVCMQKCIINLLYKIYKSNNNNLGDNNEIVIYVDGDKNPFDKKYLKYLKFMNNNGNPSIKKTIYDKLSNTPRLLNKNNNNNIKIECLVKGDSKIYEISCASILAKQYRDRKMVELHSKYPWYGWNRNFGYGTKSHFESIQKYGFTLVHRKTFIQKYL